MSHFHEAGDVSAFHVVDEAVGFAAVFETLSVDRSHDSVEFFVYFGFAPLEVHSVLAHFEAGSGYAACVHSLTGSVSGARVDEGVDCFGGAAHVRHFSHHFYAVGHQCFGVVAVEFVLGSAGKSDLHFAFPRLFAGEKFRAGEFFSVGSHDVVAGSAEFEHVFNLFVVKAGGVVDVAVGTGDGHYLSTEFGCFLGSAPSHVAETGDSHGFACDVLAFFFEHALHEVESAVAGGFGTDERTAEFEAFAGECAGVFVHQTFVHAKHVANFAAAYADITGGHVAVGTEVLPQAEHEGLAEAHDFTVALATGREVATAFTAAHRQGGEGVFECLFKAEEFEDREVHGSVEADTAFVRANGVVELHAIADVVLYFAFVVDPGYAEGNDTVGFNHAFDDFVALELGVLVVHFFYREQYFFHCLQIFFFTGMLGFQVSH